VVRLGPSPHHGHAVLLQQEVSLCVTATHAALYLSRIVGAVVKVIRVCGLRLGVNPSAGREFGRQRLGLRGKLVSGTGRPFRIMAAEDDVEAAAQGGSGGAKAAAEEGRGLFAVVPPEEVASVAVGCLREWNTDR
jgi:hypothetical protein